jgi:hypothetical protein
MTRSPKDLKRSGGAADGKRERVRLRADGAEGSDSSAGDKIGYGKPPQHQKWHKGQSGNPAGRQKGSKNKKTIIVRLMEEKLGRPIDNPSKLSRHEAMLLKGIQKALAGDAKAMAFILRRYDDAADAQAVTRVATEQDETVYAALVEKIKRELKESK